jgi:hypothetical protein
MKTHFGYADQSMCGRGTRTTENIYSVTCGHCQRHPMYERAKATADAAREAAFHAQTPRTIVPQFGRVNDDGVMECYQCKGVLFRERPRTSWSYHYVCAECGTSMHPLTETGMCT